MGSRSLNRVLLIGNLTRDPELKYTPAGTAVCTFGIATNRSWKTADGQTKEDVQYHRIVAWQKLAELCGKLLTKGRKLFLEGRLVYRTFTGRDGQQRTIAEIVLDDFIVFSDGRRPPTASDEMPAHETAKSGVMESGEEQPPVEEEPVSGPTHDEKTTGKSPTVEKKEVKNEDVNPDDIPF